MRDLQPGKLKNKLVVRAKLTQSTHCLECWNDMVEYTEQTGIKFEIELDGSFPVALASYYWHDNNTCPHEGPYKGTKLLKSAYV